ncbi:serine/threonine protein kinase [Vacuolonema iberomarrocanum]|uniref:serine/threonine protein kinase n=1 Tax=Vacuolonema iberomarrocanum TaxID=3454632 RepID=UPI001A0A1E99|nr:serine/threonine protein kinase [filamentous cyanobacterium LEGE 07170]
MPSSGQQICERYLLQRRFGNTAASRQTWLALDAHHHDKPVILKLLAFHPQMQLEELKLFEREAQILQSLDHPQIPNYHDYFSDEQDVLWFGLVQDYIPGVSLQERLHRGDIFSEADVQHIALCLLHILNYLHQQEPPVLHRDIKPSNIIWGEDDQLYLIDFGAVQNQAALTGVTFTVVGSSGYAPLEQFWGRAVPSSDLYALGATLIHLLSGISPIDLPQQNGRLQLPEAVAVTPFFRAWIEKLVDPIQEKRFATANEALDSLQQQTLPKPPAPLRRVPKPQVSDIIIRRNLTSRSIVIPIFGGGNVAGYGCAIGCWTLLLSTFVGTFLGLYFGLSGGFALAGGITLLVLGFSLGQKTEIGLKRDRLSIRRKFCGILFRKRFLLRKDILGVFWLQSNLSNGLVVRTENESLRLRSGLSDQECLWLVQELQDWLQDR